MEAILLAREADARSIIEGRTFENFLILGPAVVAPVDEIEMHACTWEAPPGNPDALFIEVPENRQLVGVVGVRNVTFTKCTFRNIGVIGSAQAIEFMRTGIMGTDIRIGGGR